MPTSNSSPFGAHRRCTSAERMMWITPDRVFYAGLLGAQTLHSKGSIQLYVALEGPLRIRLEGGAWQTCEVAVVQPYVRHQTACEGRHVLSMYVEPETVDPRRLPAMLLERSGVVIAPAFAARVRRCHARMVAAGRDLDLQPCDFDMMIFGESLGVRVLDRRIAAVVQRIKQNPAAQALAEDCAAQATLSFSRFLHLFKREMGVPFRAFRMWKRARSLLQYLHSDESLTFLALDVGYPDSTHFSHSIRNSFGLSPSDIVVGSRKLRVIEHSAAPLATR